MKFTTAIVAAFAATMAVAAPVAEAGWDWEVEATAAALPLVDFWVNANFLGLKKTGITEPETCVNFPPGFNNKVSSSRAREGWRCTVWNSQNCVGRAFSYNNAHGAPRLPSWINDKASSWKCVAA